MMGEISATNDMIVADSSEKKGQRRGRANQELQRAIDSGVKNHDLEIGLIAKAHRTQTISPKAFKRMEAGESINTEATTQRELVEDQQNKLAA